MSDLPPGWEWATLGDVADVHLGRQRSPQHHSGPHMRPYLRAANVTWGGLDLSDVKEMNFAPTDAETFELKPRDILLNEASGSSREVGKPAIWRGEIQGCCFQNTLLRLRTLGPTTEYLYWYCLSVALAGKFGDAGRGVNIRHLGKEGLVRYPLPLAPLPEQQRIVAAIEEHLSLLDAAAGEVHSARLRFSALERSLLAEAQAVGTETPLDELLVDIEAGRSFKTPGHRAGHEEWGVIKVSAMTWGEFRPDENKAVPDAVQVDTRHEIREGDLLLSRANTSEYVGATVLVGPCDARLLLSDKSMRLLPKPGIDKRWLRFALSSPAVRRQMSVLATGTSDSMRNISQAKVKRLVVRVPDTVEQARVADRIESALVGARLLRAGVESAGRRCAALRRSILAAAFSGELVQQDPSDEPASVLLERVRAERVASAPVRRRRTKVSS